MSGRVFEVLQEVRKLQDLQQESGLLYLEVFGNSADIRRPLLRAMAKAGIPEDRRDRPIHRLRDTFGTKLAEKGVPADRIQKLMGHKTISMTLKYIETREQGQVPFSVETVTGSGECVSPSSGAV